MIQASACIGIKNQISIPLEFSIYLDMFWTMSIMYYVIMYVYIYFSIHVPNGI